MSAGMFGRGRRVWLKTKYLADRTNDRLKERMREANPRIPFEQVERRLEILITALYGKVIPIQAIKNDLWTRDRVRRFAKRGRDPRAEEVPPTIEGETIMLPPELSAHAGEAETIARYRLMAIEQAERLTRGTTRVAPMDDPLERDLYLLREGAAVDAAIVRNHPGFTDILSAERVHALAHRPSLEMLTPQERDVETFMRDALSTELASAAPPSENSEASLAWAKETAARVRRDGGNYRGLPAAAYWGTLRPNNVQLPTPTAESWHSIQTGNFESEYAQSRRGQVQGEDSTAGDSANPDGSPSEKDAETAEDGDQRQRRPDPDDARRESSQYAASAGSELHEIIHGEKGEDLPPAIYYEEWSVDRHAYVKGGAAVRLYPAEEGDEEWARRELITHGATVRQIRHQFERLRARRALLSRQRAGDELDVAACVQAMVDRRIGNAPDDRLYLDARPARRGLAITLLVDASGSTDSRVTPEWRIVDVEKIALLLATQALDALGDLYAVYAFAGRAAE
ncbi:MAG TPA: hypothetical protein VGM67_12735, partial [Gemmatimonadaceae bacterium]